MFVVCDIREITASVGVVGRPRVWRLGGIIKLLSMSLDSVLLSLSLDSVVTSEGLPGKDPSEITSRDGVVANTKMVDQTVVVEFLSGVFQHRDGFLSGVFQHRDGFLSGVFQHRDFVGVASV